MAGRPDMECVFFLHRYDWSVILPNRGTESRLTQRVSGSDTICRRRFDLVLSTTRRQITSTFEAALHISAGEIRVDVHEEKLERGLRGRSR